MDHPSTASPGSAQGPEHGLRPQGFGPTAAAYPPDGLRLCTLVIDAEESFDWQTPHQGTARSTSCMRMVPLLHELVGAYGIVPAYLLTYPVLGDADVVRMLRRHHAQGRCTLGLQLHTWVTPPFGEPQGSRYSFATNLPPDLEEAKLLRLKARFVECFGFEPTVFRSGRYGMSPATPALLEKHGFLIDTSLAPRTDFAPEGGPDFKHADYELFWFGANRSLLELPLCRSVVGWGGALANPAYRAAVDTLPAAAHLPSVLTRSRFAERVTLSPEDNDVPAMRRLVAGLAARGQTVLALSFHSSSLELGGNPYVDTKPRLHLLYDRLSDILDQLTGSLGYGFTDIDQLPGRLLPPPLPKSARP